MGYPPDHVDPLRPAADSSLCTVSTMRKITVLRIVD